MESKNDTVSHLPGGEIVSSKGYRNDMPKIVLRSTLGYLEREVKRRSEGGASRALRLQDGELAALVDVLRREVGTPEMAGESEIPAANA